MSAKVYSHYIISLLEHSQRIGFNPTKLLSDINLTRVELSQNIDVNSEYAILLMQRLWSLTNDEGFNFSLSPVPRGIFAMSAKLALHSPNLHSALIEFCSAYRLTASDIQFRLNISKQQTTIFVDVNTGTKDPDHFLLQLSIMTIHRYASWLIGCDIPVIEIGLPYDQPIEQQHYPYLLFSNAEYNQECAEISFPSKYLNYRPIRNRQELHDFINQAPKGLIEIQSKDLSYLKKIKSLILEPKSNSLVIPTFDFIAKQFNLSSPTLRRYLQQEGTSFQQIKDLLRREICIEKLINTNLSIASIAEYIGYSETAALNRAFKKWTNLTPAAYRHKFSSIQNHR